MVFVEFLGLFFAIHFGVMGHGCADSDLAILGEGGLHFELGGAYDLELECYFVVGVDRPGETLSVVEGVEGEGNGLDGEEEGEEEEEIFHRLYND